MLLQDFLQRGPHHIGMAAGPVQAFLRCHCRSHGNEISLAIQILTPLSHLILILISSHLIFHLINVLSDSSSTLISLLVYFCRRTTFYLSLQSQGLYYQPQICNSLSSLSCPSWLLPLLPQLVRTILFISSHVDDGSIFSAVDTSTMAPQPP